MDKQFVSLKFVGPTYHSNLDEESFYWWLGQMPSIKEISGKLQEVHLSVDAEGLNNQELHDLIGLHKRFLLPMRHLTRLETSANSARFRDRNAYWYNEVFGETSEGP